jgi:predicted Zn-dependent protease
MPTIGNLVLRFGAVGLLGSGLAVNGCATAGSISAEQEAQLGAQYSAEINQQLPIVQNSAIHSYINQLGRSISSRVDPRLNYTFYVVDAPEVNAFAVPGGYIYINRGLIERAATMSELAGVLGHEIGHVVERHGLEQMARMQNTQLGVNIAYVLLGRQPGTVEQVALQGGASAFFASHSRADENQADVVAVQYMVQSGIDPNGMVTMFQRLIEEQQRSPSAVEQWFSTHPLTQDRIENVRSLIAATGSTGNLRRDNQAYQTFRSRVRALR